MELHEIKGTLEHILSQDVLSKDPRLKVEVIRLLKVLQNVITPEEFRRIKLLSKVSLNIKEDELHFLLENPEERWSIIEEVKPTLDEIKYPTKGGWIENYLDYTKLQESPIEFHFWVALCLIGATLKRSVWFDKQEYYQVFPSLFVILVAVSGRCKKSTAIRLGLKLLKDVNYVNVLPEKATPEALLDSISCKKKVGQTIVTETYAMIGASELEFFLGRQAYNEGLIPMLTELADCPPKMDYRTRSKGTILLKEPGITFLGGTTKEGLENSVPASSFGQGFFSRILFIHKGDSPRCNSMMEPAKEDRYSFELLKEELRQIEKVSGQFVASPDGVEWYNEFYAKNKFERPLDKNMCGYFERKPDHLIKLAMIMAVAEGKPMILTADIFERSKFILDQAEQPMPDAFITVGASPSGQNSTRLLSVIKANGGKITWSGGLKACYRTMGKWEYERAVETLVFGKLIEEYRTRSEHILLLKE